MKVYSIYKITNLLNEKTYIGFTNNFLLRKKRHRRDSDLKDSKLYRAIKKYGWNNFEFEIIYQSFDGQHTLNVMENHFINEYNSYHYGYNETLGGNGSLGRSYSHTEETKIKMKMAKHGHVPWNKGKTNVYSEQFLKYKSENTVFRTLKKTESHKQNISNSMKGRKQTDQHIRNRVESSCKSYIMIDPEGEIINIRNMSDFCKRNGLNQSNMIGVCRGRPGFISHKGYKKYEP